jgi:hypothetical protein
MSWSSQWSLSFWHSHQYLICIPLLPIRATRPTRIILLDLIILIILGETPDDIIVIYILIFTFYLLDTICNSGCIM